jgi:hypothetical protein
VQKELILEEKRRKSAIGTNGTNGNGNKPVLINEIQEDNQIVAIRGNNYRPYQTNQRQQGQQNQPNQKMDW